MKKRRKNREQETGKDSEAGRTTLRSTMGPAESSAMDEQSGKSHAGRQTRPGLQPLLSPRRLVLLMISAAGLWAYLYLGIGPGDLLPGTGQAKALTGFFSRALSPALDYESGFVARDAAPLLLNALDAARRTVVFAAAAMSLALVAGVVLGFAGSKSWRDLQGRMAGGASRHLRIRSSGFYVAVRMLITMMRSVHELIWAVLFLAALGLSNLSAVIAIAIPYAGTLAKVFSEMIDETPRDAARALSEAGASGGQVFAFGLLPRAIPDMSAYTLYRFECALRSSAVVGFFGPETLGKFIKLSWNENHYGEVWTYLYALFLLIVVVDWWSGALRKRFAA